MAKARITPNQVVAHNLRRARGLRDWTQEQAAEKLEPYLGERWSRVVFSAAERSVAGKRIRQFTADDLVAFAAAFELPIPFFLSATQSATPEVEIAAPGAREVLTADDLAELAGDYPQERVDDLIEEHYKRIGIPYSRPKKENR